MKISTKGRYAVRLMLDVAIHGMDKNVSMRDVAERQNISIKYLEQIVSILTRVGYFKECAWCPRGLPTHKSTVRIHNRRYFAYNGGNTFTCIVS